MKYKSESDLLPGDEEAEREDAHTELVCQKWELILLQKGRLKRNVRPKGHTKTYGQPNLAAQRYCAACRRGTFLFNLPFCNKINSHFLPQGFRMML